LICFDVSYLEIKKSRKLNKTEKKEKFSKPKKKIKMVVDEFSDMKFPT